jgi:hypothetical protein
MKKRITKASICRKYGITAATLSAWELEGVDPYDDHAMRERNARKHKAGGEDIHAARLRKLTADANYSELRGRELEGRLIDIQEVEQAFTKLGAVAKSLLLRMQADLPPMLEGQSPSRMSVILGEAINAVLTQMSDPQFTEWKK